MEVLKASRFWVMTMGIISSILIDPSFSTQEWYVSLGKFLALMSAGFVSIRTVDRFSEKVGTEDCN